LPAVQTIKELSWKNYTHEPYTAIMSILEENPL